MDLENHVTSTGALKNQGEEKPLINLNQKLDRLFQSQSEICLNKQLSYLNFTADTANGLYGVYDHDMSIIMLANDKLKVTLKTHFNPIFIENILMEKMSALGRPVSNTIIYDFVKEFNNQFGGLVKIFFQAIGTPLAISIPFVTRGFDNYYHQISPNSSDIKHIGYQTFNSWKLKSPKGYLTCSYHVLVMDSALIDPILQGEIIESVDESEQEIELL